MRIETIPNTTLTVRWRDERRAMASITDSAEWQALLRQYAFGQQPLTDAPVTVANERYQVTLAEASAADSPRVVTIERKPQTPVQEFAWIYAEETRMARIECIDDELGVRFLDEDSFVPFSRLALRDGGFAILAEPVRVSVIQSDPNRC